MLGNWYRDYAARPPARGSDIQGNKGRKRQSLIMRCTCMLVRKRGYEILDNPIVMANTPKTSSRCASSPVTSRRTRPLRDVIGTALPHDHDSASAKELRKWHVDEKPERDAY